MTLPPSDRKVVSLACSVRVLMAQSPEPALSLLDEARAVTQIGKTRALSGIGTLRTSPPDLRNPDFE